MTNFYKTHRAYLEARRCWWLSQVNRTDDCMDEGYRKHCKRLLSRILKELDEGE